MIDHAQNPKYLEFANRVLGVRFDPREAVTIASVIDGEIAGVTVYSRVSRWKCEMSVASVSPRFLGKDYLRAVFGYPFIQCGMKAVIAVSEMSNKRAIEFNMRVGFEPKSILEDWFGDQDGLLLYMRSSDCRWIDEKRTPRTPLVHAA